MSGLGVMRMFGRLAAEGMCQQQTFIGNSTRIRFVNLQLSSGRAALRENASDRAFHNGFAPLNRRATAGQLTWRWTNRACRLLTGALPMANASSLKGLMTFLRRDEW